jgi:hypothetical protein
MTVEEVLRQSGFTADQIAALEPRAITAFTGVLTAAEQERSRAEVERRANVDFYENQIAPSLTQWEEEKQRLDNERARVVAEAAFYKTQNEQARASGFIATDAPTYNGQSRDGQGRYVANAPGGTPGSPQFFDVNKVYEKAGDAVGLIADIQWEHQRLFGTPLPVSPSELIRQADAVKLDPKTFAERKFDFAGKRAEMAQKQQTERDSKIKQDAITERDRYWSERRGSNPDVYQPHENAKMTEIARAAKTGSRGDPLMMGENERRQATRTAIRTELAENA